MTNLLHLISVIIIVASMAPLSRAFAPATILRISKRGGRTFASSAPQSGGKSPAGRKGLSMALGSEPKKGFVRSDKGLDMLGSAFQLVTRLGSGGFVQGWSIGLEKETPETMDDYAPYRFGGYRVVEKAGEDIQNRVQPEKPIELYEFEGCPFCRKVREAVNILDLDVLYYPCPQDSPTFRPRANELGGKKMFPYMVDPNTGTSMYESDDIIKYLFQTYGAGAEVPLGLRLGMLTVLSAGVGLMPRAMKGSKYTPAKMPEKPLELWGYEASPFTKIVREKLCELEIPHKFVTCARGSPKKQQLMAMAGTGQTPYLIDPNTGQAGYESAEIVDYLESTYQL